MNWKAFLVTVTLAALAGCGGGGGGDAQSGSSPGPSPVNTPGGGATPAAQPSPNATYIWFGPDLTPRQVQATVAASGIAIEGATVSSSDGYASASFSGAFGSGVALAAGKLLMLCSGNTDTATHLALSSEAERVTNFADLAGRRFKDNDCALKDKQATIQPGIWEFDADGALKIRGLSYSASARDAIFSDAGLKTDSFGGNYRAQAYRVGTQYFLVYLNDETTKKYLQIGAPQ